MHSRMRQRIAALTSAAGLVALSCAGCSLFKPPAAHPVSCNWTQAGSVTPNTAAATSNVVVLIDTSASYWPARGGSGDWPDSPEQAQVVADLTRGFGLGGTRLVSLGTFDGSSTAIDWQVSHAALPPATGATPEIRRQQKDAEGCLRPFLRTALGSVPQARGTDVMSALGAAGSQLGSTAAGHDHVLVYTDGLSNAGCLNLSQVLRRGVSVAAALHACRHDNGLTQLRGVDVRLAGIGFQALGRPLSSSEQNWLEDYWKGLCAGLDVVARPSCIVPQGASTARASTVSRLRDPRIVFAPKVKGPDLVVPAPLLFAFNSARLTQSARAYLDILVQRIRSSHRPVTEVVGHTDHVGSAAYNLGLSRRRARAVRDYLATRGFTGVAAIGVGFSQPACPQTYAPSCMARDRRVVIVLGGTHG
jgi:outer membrane protein OmpA-like peptidoglycan-associated protein